MLDCGFDQALDFGELGDVGCVTVGRATEGADLFYCLGAQVRVSFWIQVMGRMRGLEAWVCIYFVNASLIGCDVVYADIESILC